VNEGRICAALVDLVAAAGQAELGRRRDELVDALSSDLVRGLSKPDRSRSSTPTISGMDAPPKLFRATARLDGAADSSRWLYSTQGTEVDHRQVRPPSMRPSASARHGSGIPTVVHDLIDAYDTTAG